MAQKLRSSKDRRRTGACACRDRGTVLWRRLDLPGCEYCRLSSRRSRRYLEGTAVFACDDKPCRLEYRVICDVEWRTLSGRVRGRVGGDEIDVRIIAGKDRRWRVNGRECPAVAGCIDLDLNFTPSTNLLAIRRLSPAPGRETETVTAWLRFPEFTLEPLPQRYRRTGAATYRFEVVGSDYSADLRVNATGFVTHYAGFWQAEAEEC